MNFSSFEYKKAPEATLLACDLMAILENPVKTDDWATTQSKIVVSSAMTGADVTITEEPNGEAKITINPKSNLVPGQASEQADDIVVAYINTTQQKVHFCQDVQDRIITNEEGDVVGIPMTTHYLKEPTQRVA